MVRSFFNLLLAAVLLANQVELCLGHAHSGQTENGDTVRLHFHLDGQTHSHSHSPFHSHRESNSDSKSGNHEHSRDGVLDNDALQVPFDHDDDACYLTHSDAVYLTPNRDSIEFSFFAVWNCDSAKSLVGYPAGPVKLDRPSVVPRRQCAILSQTSRLLL